MECPECGKEDKNPDMKCSIATQFYAMAYFVCKNCGAMIELSYGQPMLARSTPADQVR
jgi:transcription elongation factor Elf1